MAGCSRRWLQLTLIAAPVILQVRWSSQCCNVNGVKVCDIYFLMYMLNDTQKTQSLVKPCAVSACWYEGRRKLAAWFCFRCWCYLSFTEYASSPAIENESLQLKSLRSNLSPQVLKRWEKERLGGFAKCKTRAMQLTGIHNLHQFICVWELIYDTFWFSWCLFCISRLCN